MRIANRFWEKVDYEAGKNECWEWEAAVNEHGYGRFRVDDVVNAQRVALALNEGDIKLLNEFDTVRHSCDNRSCCNPLHLTNGTPEANMIDMSKRCRGRIQKLDAGDAREIKRRYETEEGLSQYDLADTYEVTQQQISYIVRGKSFAYLD